ncbi:MAG TPA: glutamate--tRNA ligase [Caldilineae bacterium]|nr:glutamate--tRNA ligase [Caldilineae bacterium]
MTTPARVRFAPSPTGFFHIGGARTALFNWLYARHTGGQFILRIEDTDRKRFHPEALQDLLDGLRWLGLDWDEGPEVGGDYGPYLQSERLAMYQHWADWLIEQGHAYRCYCTADELAQMRDEQRATKQKIGYDRRCRYLTAEERAQKEAEGKSWVVRLAMPTDGVTTFHDAIRGDITFDNKEMQDAVLLKSDGWPTYHLAVVVDDHFMEISHVMRGNEWIATVPLRWQLYKALGWEPPIFVHLPLILKPDGKGKLSKRAVRSPDGELIPVFVHEYRERGYLPDAVVNFLTGIGWALDGETEIYDRETAIKAFSIRGIQASPGRFPADKLAWMNSVYIRKLSTDALLEALLPFLSTDLGVDEETLRQDARLRLLLPDVQERIKKLSDAAPWVEFLYADAITIENPKDLIPRKTTPEQTIAGLTRSAELLAGLETWDEASIEAGLRDLVGETGLKAGQIFSPIRTAITGKRVALPLFISLAALGQAASVERIRAAISQVPAADG